jgi:hypothetical protein
MRVERSDTRLLDEPLHLDGIESDKVTDLHVTDASLTKM